MGVLIDFIMGVLLHRSYHGSYGGATGRTSCGTAVESVGCTTRGAPLARWKIPHGTPRDVLWDALEGVYPSCRLMRQRTPWIGLALGGFGLGVRHGVS